MTVPRAAFGTATRTVAAGSETAAETTIIAAETTVVPNAEAIAETGVSAPCWHCFGWRSFWSAG